ncbi:hypothetical protein [Pseudoalteromonas sp. TB64]|uniref:hypothetical protein n=1 Tax=Pseudoalteromonas sp. TB64 TaxID=1938600 RepID=UPI000428CA51|nr:hypothetical protein [Pseudoalteromonas sp. TB64]
MFKKTLLALAIAGVSITANAAVVKTTSAIDATAKADVETLLKTQLGAGKSGLGADDFFSDGVDPANDNCEDLALELGATTEVATFTPANAGIDTATFGTGNDGLAKNLVQYTAADACTVYLAAETGVAVAKDGVEYSTVKAIEIKPVVVAGIGGYKDEDTLTFQISGAKLDTALTTAPTISVGALGQSGAGVTFDVLDITESQVRFTVQGATSQTDFVKGNAALKLEGLFLDSTGLASSTSVNVNSFATNTSGTKFDEASAATIVTLVPQYTAEVTNAFDESIDVGKDRQEFAFGSTDTLNLKVENNVSTAPVGLALVPDVATFVITGDFSWMLDDDIDLNEDGDLTTTELAKAVTYNGSASVTKLALNADKTQLTITTKVAGAVDTAPSITFTVAGFDQGKLENVLIPVQSFSVKVDVLSDKSIGNKTANMEALDTSAAGQWELNGSVVVLPYIPFGVNTQPVIRHTNAGTRVGDVTMRYMIEGEDVTWKALPGGFMADVKPGVRNLLTTVTDALKAEGYNTANGNFKAAIEIVTNVPSRDVHVFAGAKVTSSDSSRMTLTSYKTNN